MFVTTPGAVVSPPHRDAKTRVRARRPCRRAASRVCATMRARDDEKDDDDDVTSHTARGAESANFTAAARDLARRATCATMAVVLTTQLVNGAGAFETREAAGDAMRGVESEFVFDARADGGRYYFDPRAPVDGADGDEEDGELPFGDERRAFVEPGVFPRGDGPVNLPMPAKSETRDASYRTVQVKQRLTDGERETVNLFNDAKSSVVYITNVAVRRDAFTLNLTEAPQGAGSGIVWDAKGHIVTNYHVIAKANQLKVSFLPKEGGVAKQKVFDAAIVGFDDDKDIAVLQVTDPEALRVMKPLVIGTSGEAMVGQRVYAIGNPFGLDHTLTTGIISGLGREIQSGNTGRPIDGIIQTDAAINPGNSGGPLLNSSGQLIGINTAIYSASGTSSGVGFALPSDMVSGIVDQIIRTGRVTRPILGVSFAPDGALDQLGLGGVLVLDAREGGPAYRAGVRSTSRDESGRLILGDIIIELAGEPIQDSSDLYRTLDKLQVGETVEMKLIRGVEKVTTQIQLDDIKDMKPPSTSNIIIPMKTKKSPNSPY